MPNGYKAYHRLKKEKLSVALPKDVLRHSFASYGYHKLGAEHTIEIMGHITGFKVFVTHYKGLSSKNTAKEYFNITPETVKAEMAKRSLVKEETVYEKTA